MVDVAKGEEVGMERMEMQSWVYRLAGGAGGQCNDLAPECASLRWREGGDVRMMDIRGMCLRVF